MLDNAALVKCSVFDFTRDIVVRKRFQSLSLFVFAGSRLGMAQKIMLVQRRALYHREILCSPILFLQASTSTYNASHMCGSPATDFGYRDPGMLHQVTMDG